MATKKSTKSSTKLRPMKTTAKIDKPPEPEPEPEPTPEPEKALGYIDRFRARV